MATSATASLPLAHLLPVTAALGECGALSVGGCDLPALAREYGTPLYVYDLETLQRQARGFIEAFREEHAETTALYAAKAFLNRPFARLIAAEGFGFDAVSGRRAGGDARRRRRPRHDLPAWQQQVARGAARGRRGRRRPRGDRQPRRDRAGRGGCGGGGREPAGAAARLARRRRLHAREDDHRHPRQQVRRRHRDGRRGGGGAAYRGRGAPRSAGAAHAPRQPDLRADALRARHRGGHGLPGRGLPRPARGSTSTSSRSGAGSPSATRASTTRRRPPPTRA